jgi:hypothetical protein
MAADNHDRAARYWEGQQDSERAELQREMAKYERHGAELERRWADLVDPDPAHRETRAAEQVMRHTREGATHASTILTRLAKTLDKSARMAELHAARREHAGHSDDAATELQSAKRARTAARRARSQAEQWLKVAHEQDT